MLAVRTRIVAPYRNRTTTVRSRDGPRSLVMDLAPRPARPRPAPSAPLASRWQRAARPTSTAIVAVTLLLVGQEARAESTGYADPPPDDVFVVSSQPPPESRYTPPPVRLPPASPFRVSVGPIGRISSHAFAPGLGTALDFGRGPAGFRATAAFVKVGDANPLAQYGGEITLALPAYGRFVPTFGVGAALARVKRVDENGATASGGANLGVGTLRGGVDVRLPFDDTDARALIGATVNVPVVRGEGAPSESTWALLGASVAVGF